MEEVSLLDDSPQKWKIPGFDVCSLIRPFCMANSMQIFKYVVIWLKIELLDDSPQREKSVFSTIVAHLDYSVRPFLGKIININNNLFELLDDSPQLKHRN